MPDPKHPDESSRPEDAGATAHSGDDARTAEPEHAEGGGAATAPDERPTQELPSFAPGDESRAEGGQSDDEADADGGGPPEAGSGAPVPPRPTAAADGRGGNGKQGEESEGSGKGIAWVALLLALAALAMTGYREMQRQDEPAATGADAPAVDVEARLAEAAGATGATLETFRTELGELGDRVSSVQAAVQSVRDDARAMGTRNEEIQSTVNAVEARVEGRAERLGTLEGDIQRLTEDVRNAVREARTVAEEVRASMEEMAGVEGRLRAELNSLDQRFDSVQRAVSALSEYEQGGESMLLLAEAEFLLRLAGERLELFRDPEMAVSAMEQATSHLRAVDDPVYASVRRTLAGEIERLEELDLPDLAELSGRIGRLAEASSAWPVDERRTLDRSANVLEPEEDEAGWWARFREVASEVAVVHRDTGEATLMLTLEEERLLRENVRLQLQIAQVAAIRGDTSLYRSALAQARQWLETYYDPDAGAVSQAIADLETLETIDVSPALPEIGSALRELRQARALSTTADEAP